MFTADLRTLNYFNNQNFTFLINYFSSYINFYFNNFLSLLIGRYSKIKKKYPLIGIPSKLTFYYWAAFSYNRLKGFKILRTKFFGFKFTQFYFTPSMLLVKQQKYKFYLVALRKKISFFKKSNTINKSTLFRIGSHSWKRVVFRRSLWKNINTLVAHKKKNVKTNYLLNKPYSGKGVNYTFFKKSNNTNKKIKAPINITKKFSRTFFINRKIFESLLGFKSLRQLRFTRYFSNFFKKNPLKILYSFEFNIVNILIKSRFVFTKQGAISLLKSNFVFVNGFLVTNENTVLKVTDRVQLIISNNFFFYYRRCLSNLQSLKKKTGYRVWLLTRFIFNFYKQSMKNIPKWVSKLVYYKLDVPKFLEVDYTLLCSIILYYPNPLFETDIYNIKYINLSLLRLYNWKYVV